MRIAVLGTGGIGGYFGGRLAAGHDVTFVARGPHLAAIRDHGLVVTSVAGTSRWSPRASPTTPPRSVRSTRSCSPSRRGKRWPRCSRSCPAWSAPTQRSSRPRTASRPRAGRHRRRARVRAARHRQDLRLHRVTGPRHTRGRPRVARLRRVVDSARGTVGAGHPAARGRDGIRRRVARARKHLGRFVVEDALRRALRRARRSARRHHR